MRKSPPITRTPQDKKALSLVKDRRNDYRANAKASRKAIPLRKAIEHRKTRHKATQALGMIDTLDEAAAALAESSLRHDVARVGGWTKCPDAALKDHIAGQQAKADRLVGRKGRVRTERARQLAAPDYSGVIMILSAIHDRD